MSSATRVTEAVERGRGSLGRLVNDPKVYNELVAATGSLSTGEEEGDYRFLVTGDVDSFVEDGARFLQLPLANRVSAASV